jgi:peptidoglycan/LPS O-acetylase OafA/YrhL
VLDMLLRFLQSLLVGDASYHLYFLLVTMQVYLLMPLILWLVRRTRRHHVLLLVLALVAQLVVLGVWEYLPGATAAVGNADNATFPSYAFMILAGAVAADHSDGFLASLRAHRGRVLLLVGGTGALTLLVFTANVRIGGFSYSHAVTALQPVIAVWATGIGVGLLALGAWWADRDPPHRLSTAVATASDLSFGVFLVHPLVLALVLQLGGSGVSALPDPWVELVVYLVVVVVSIGFAWVVRRTPLSLPLAGRPRRGPVPARVPAEVAAR